MAFKLVCKMGDVEFYEAALPLKVGEAGRIKAVNYTVNYGKPAVPCVYQFPIMDGNDERDYRRFLAVAGYIGNGCGMALPGDLDEFARAYHENKDWITRNKMVTVRLNGSDMRGEIAPYHAEMLLSADNRPLAQIARALRRIGIPQVAGRMIRRIGDELAAEGLDALSDMDRTSRSFLATPIFLDLAKHEQGLTVSTHRSTLEKVYSMGEHMASLYDEA